MRPSISRRGRCGISTCSSNIPSIALQARSASSKLLNGEPMTLIAPVRELSGRHDARKPCGPRRPEPVGLAKVITNEMSALLALQTSMLSTARWNWRDILTAPQIQPDRNLMVKCDGFGFANFRPMPIFEAAQDEEPQPRGACPNRRQSRRCLEDGAPVAQSGPILDSDLPATQSTLLHTTARAVSSK